MIRSLLLQIGIEIIDVVSVGQEYGGFEHAVVAGTEEEAPAGNEQFLHHHHQFLPADAHIAEHRKTGEAGLDLQQVIRLFEETTFGQFCWQLAEAVRVGRKVELDGLAERAAEDHDTAVDAVDVGFD